MVFSIPAWAACTTNDICVAIVGTGRYTFVPQCARHSIAGVGAPRIVADVWVATAAAAPTTPGAFMLSALVRTRCLDPLRVAEE